MSLFGGEIRPRGTLHLRVIRGRPTPTGWWAVVARWQQRWSAALRRLRWL